MHNISYIWNKCMYMTVDKINKTCLNNILRQGKKLILHVIIIPSLIFAVMKYIITSV